MSESYRPEIGYGFDRPDIESGIHKPEVDTPGGSGPLEKPGEEDSRNDHVIPGLETPLKKPQDEEVPQIPPDEIDRILDKIWRKPNNGGLPN